MSFFKQTARLFDITWPISTSVASWPGDTPFALKWTLRQSQGDSVNVSRVTLSPHTGTHADAPFHYDASGVTIDQVDVSVFLGPARLVDVRGCRPIRIQDLTEVDGQRIPRLLLRTGAWEEPSRFPDAIPVMAEDVPAFLYSEGVRLVGLDVPSVDVLDSKSLPIHRQLGRHGIQILEGLDLREPPPGLYELIALPLKITGADGSPVRAVLRESSLTVAMRQIAAFFAEIQDSRFEEELMQLLVDAGWSAGEAREALKEALNAGYLERTSEMRDAAITPLGMEGCRQSEPWLASVLRATPRLQKLLTLL